ncbi:MAG TPA: hypothetical protein VFQ53_03360 [Kofleriaceae bacterium]|nr:hypothetical protein [Kofleriaceae bacterium]
MHVEFGTALVIVGLIAALLLALERGDRAFPVIAALTAILETLIQLGIVSIAAGKWRMDVILPAILVVCGGLSLARASVKSATIAATLLLSVGLIQLCFALGVLE